VLREGLPQEHAYDVVHRHARAIDKSGDRLAFATTSGLYLTGNQGDHWGKSATHCRLPMR
jgi:hypothetical protein